MIKIILYNEIKKILNHHKINYEEKLNTAFNQNIIEFCINSIKYEIIHSVKSKNTDFYRKSNTDKKWKKTTYDSICIAVVFNKI